MDRALANYRAARVTEERLRRLVSTCTDKRALSSLQMRLRRAIVASDIARDRLQRMEALVGTVAA